MRGDIYRDPPSRSLDERPLRCSAALVIIASAYRESKRTAVLSATLRALGEWRMLMTVELLTDSLSSRQQLQTLLAPTLQVIDALRPRHGCEGSSSASFSVAIAVGDKNASAAASTTRADREMRDYRLTWRHRERLDSWIERFGLSRWDFYAYLEDDMMLTWPQFLAWQDDTVRLMTPAAAGGCGQWCTRSFVRYERWDGQGYVLDVPNTRGQPLLPRGDTCSVGVRTLALLSDAYQGFWLQTREQLVAFRRSACWSLREEFEGVAWKARDAASKRALLRRSGGFVNWPAFWGTREVAAAGPLACSPHPCVPIANSSVDPLAAVWHSSETVMRHFVGDPSLSRAPALASSVGGLGGGSSSQAQSHSSRTHSRLLHHRPRLRALFHFIHGQKGGEDAPVTFATEAGNVTSELDFFSRPAKTVDRASKCPSLCQPACIPQCFREVQGWKM